MAQATDTSETNSLKQWVLGLAVAIFCCAIVFHFVATFIANTQERIAVTQLKLEYLEARLNILESQPTTRLIQLTTPNTAPNPAVVAPAPQANPPTSPPLSLPQLAAPLEPVPDTKIEKAPALSKTEKSDQEIKPAEKIVIVPSTELLLNTRTEIPDAAVAADKIKPEKQADDDKTKTSVDKE